MKRILVLWYSQSGDVTKAVEAFVRPLEAAGGEVTRACIRPVGEFPSPWRTLPRLFNVFPECFLGPPVDLCPLQVSPADHFDLVVLGYQAWHLAPSIPVQSFLSSPYARLLAGKQVITLCVSRNMWQSASETMKQMLRDAGAVHTDNIVVTHQGPPLSTFVSVPRALLYGKRDRLWGIFPPADLSETDLRRVEVLGTTVAQHLDALGEPSPRPLLTGLGPVKVVRRYILPERAGWHFYRAAARLVQMAGRQGRWARYLAVRVFMLVMLLTILIGIPLSMLVTLLLFPVLRGKIERDAARLAEPSG